MGKMVVENGAVAFVRVFPCSLTRLRQECSKEIEALREIREAQSHARNQQRKQGREGALRNGGEGEIRTHGTRKGSTVFETAAFDHSATSPTLLI
jgi:hypothetical protein